MKHQTICFVHIPKTAGVSIRETLLRAALDAGITREEVFDWRLVPDLAWTRMRTMNGTQAYRLVMAHMSFSHAQRFHNPYIVTILRHPIERLLSSYFHYLRLTGREHDEGFLDEFSDYNSTRNTAVAHLHTLDIDRSTTFAAEGEGRPFIGYAFNDPTAVSRIEFRQKTHQAVSFAIQCSDDGFTHDVRLADHRAVAGHDGQMTFHLDAAPPAKGWRVVRLRPSGTNPMSSAWFVTSIRLFDEEGNLLAGGGRGRGTAIGSEAIAPTSPDMAFDGLDERGVNDLVDLNDLDLQSAEANLRRCAVVGFMDALPTFLKRIGADTGLPFREIARKNINPDPRYDVVSTRARDLIAQRNHLDMALYEFARDHFPTRSSGTHPHSAAPASL